MRKPEGTREVDEALDEAKVASMDLAEDDFELEVWMSTDGKHTVKGKALQKEAKHKMVTKILEIYDYIKERYGTKQQLNSETYSQNGQFSKKIDPKECAHTNPRFAQVKKDGPNKGRWFRSCKDCGQFLGFQP